MVYKLAISSAKPNKKDILVSAVIAAVGVQILQAIGGYLVTHQLRSLTNLYGTFAVVLGLLFWIYLQAQVVLYAAEISAVRSMKLWPRSLQPQLGLTEADKKAYSLQAKKERYLPPEYIGVKFKEDKSD